MGLYLYCIARPENAPGLTLAGVCGGAVRIVELDPFSVWCENADRAPDPSLEAIRRHHRVVETAAEGGPVLPLRFGQWIRDPEALRTPLARRRALYEESLERVDGAVELGVRILDPGNAGHPDAETTPDGSGDGPSSPRASGRAYLEALQQRERERAARKARGEELAEELAEDLGPFLRDERAGEPAPLAGGDLEGVELVSVAHLVAREDVERHGAVVRSFGERHPGLRIVTSGPWPPYSFTPGSDPDGIQEKEGRRP